MVTMTEFKLVTALFILSISIGASLRCHKCQYEMLASGEPQGEPLCIAVADAGDKIPTEDCVNGSCSVSVVIHGKYELWQRGCADPCVNTSVSMTIVGGVTNASALKCCEFDDCNSNNPVNPGIGGAEHDQSCLSCQYDSRGASGDRGCVEPQKSAKKFNAKCASGLRYCSTKVVKRADDSRTFSRSCSAACVNSNSSSAGEQNYNLCCSGRDCNSEFIISGAGSVSVSGALALVAAVLSYVGRTSSSLTL